MTGFVSVLRRLARSSSGLAVIEFALGAPVLLTAGLFGAEAANRAIMQMRVNQIAVLIADDASRVGENSLLGEVKIYESDVDDVLYGAKIQGGGSLDLYKHGRVILSSLEVLPGTEDQQYIHWQRCKGELHHTSSYGLEGDGAGSHIEGMGAPGEEVYAYQGEAVMFVEVAYTYQPLVTHLFDPNATIIAVAAFNVRDNRDLAQIYQRDPAMPDPIARCSVYDDFPARS